MIGVLLLSMEIKDRKYIKPSEYAELFGIHYRTAVRHFKEGKIEGIQDSETNTIFLVNPFYEEQQNTVNNDNKNKAILYARVSSSTNKKSLEGQIERMRLFAAAKGYEIVDEYKEIASGLNSNRKKLNKILDRNDFEILIIEYKDRLTRFGSEYIEKILNLKGQRLEIINKTNKKDEDIVDDLVKIITCFCDKVYDPRRSKKCTEKIVEIIKKKNENSL